MISENNSNSTARALHPLVISAIVGLIFGFFGAFAYIKFFKSDASLNFVTISVAKIIESEAKSIDGEMIKNGSIYSDEQIQARVERYTKKISDSLYDYSKQNKIIVLEKSAVIADGVGIKDITDEFIKAVNE